MTQDKARKTATRQRMAETGEPYSVARHAVEDEHSDPEAEAVEDSGASEPGFGARERAEQARQRLERAGLRGPSRRRTGPSRSGSGPSRRTRRP